MKKFFYRIMFLLSGFGLIGCATDQLAGGGTDTETSGMVALNDSPIQGAGVVIEDKNGDVGTDETDKDGKFSIDGVAYGAFSIDVTYTGNDSIFKYSGEFTASSESMDLGTLSLEFEAMVPIIKR